MATNDLNKIRIPDFGVELKRLQVETCAFILTTKGVLYVTDNDDVTFFPNERKKINKMTKREERIINHTHNLLFPILVNSDSLENQDEYTKYVLYALRYILNLPNLASRDCDLMFKEAENIAKYLTEKIKEMENGKEKDGKCENDDAI